MKKSTIYTALIILIVVGMAWSGFQKDQKIKELEAEVAEHTMWLDFMGTKVADLQRIADHTQTSCIDILYGNKTDIPE